ncbi:uncharacterized protein LOC127245195 [Andrographis paniculata]|uniref:uncharacterized protein LOC127245195 n=1 Tax=Andrographis paniculata TaxID=175694 RepID=UPI0021E7706C|nr:uncharacterized protein LOC127245195 [Andrographis paniculata]
MSMERRKVKFLLFIVGVVALRTTAERCRLMVGKEAASKSGTFTFLNCFDGSYGTVVCLAKEGVKLYCYNIRSLHVESRKYEAIEVALSDAVAQGMDAKNAVKVAHKEGKKAAKLATRKADRIIGPIISSGWDFLESIYFGGKIMEGLLRGTGTLFGTYSVGFLGEQKFKRIGYLVGSHFGSWIGERIGLMVYDVVNGIHYLMQPKQSEPLVYKDALDNNEAAAADKSFDGHQDL